MPQYLPNFDQRQPSSHQVSQPGWRPLKEPGQFCVLKLKRLANARKSSFRQFYFGVEALTSAAQIAHTPHWPATSVPCSQRFIGTNSKRWGRLEPALNSCLTNLVVAISASGIFNYAHKQARFGQEPKVFGTLYAFAIKIKLNADTRQGFGGSDLLLEKGVNRKE